MNVAVSRAKDAFVVVGDAGCLVGGSKSAVNVNEKVYHPLTKKFTTPLAKKFTSCY